MWVKLPGVYLDDVRTSGATALVVLNRDPYPGETGVPRRPLIQVDVMAPAGETVDQAAVEVYVGGTLAYDGAADSFAAGFDGAASGTAAPDAATLRVTVEPTADFPSEEEVDVRVVAATSGGGLALDDTYAWTVEDYVAPELSAAQARGLRRVRLEFTEAVRQEDDGTAADALTAAAYDVVRLSTPAVEVAVKSVEAVSPTEVDILLDIDATPGGTYRVDVTGVEDLAGNAADASHEFTGFEPDAPEDRDFQLWDMLPVKNRREDTSGELRLFIEILQEPLDLLLADVDRFPEILDPHTAPAPYRPRMLDDLGNPFPFAGDFAAVDQRRLLDVLVAMYREKGTRQGVENAVRFFLEIEIEVLPFLEETWVLGEDELGVGTILGSSQQPNLYSFVVRVPEELDAEKQSILDRIVDYMKPAHEHHTATEVAP